MKHLVGRKATKKTKFLDAEVEIKKLSTSAIKGLQALNQAELAEGEDRNILNLRYIIRNGAIDADVTDEEFDAWPLEDVGGLAQEIMVYSGINAGEPEVPN